MEPKVTSCVSMLIFMKAQCRLSYLQIYVCMRLSADQSTDEGMVQLLADDVKYKERKHASQYTKRPKNLRHGLRRKEQSCSVEWSLFHLLILTDGRNTEQLAGYFEVESRLYFTGRLFLVKRITVLLFVSISLMLFCRSCLIRTTNC